MSTYLTCFIVSDFDYKTQTVDTEGVGDNFDIRMFAVHHEINKVDFALDTAVDVVKFFLKYFLEAYPLPKLDMAAIPDFVSNAMEHWGLVTYREAALLHDIDTSSTWNQQRIGAVVAHELAHMWFGNLVTMKWWNDLWLNEGFARYMEYKALNNIYESWGMTEQFLIHALHGVMAYDSSTASHPIIQSVNNPDQITEIFDTICYEKGASVIRMLEDTIGEEKFAKAVRSYLKHFKYQNAVTNDFLTEVQNTGLDFDVKLFMSTWTEQMGLPLVEVRRLNNSNFVLIQKRFFSNIEDYEGNYNDSDFNYKWSIPILYITDTSSEIHRAWFNYDAEILTITVPPETNWIKLNVHQIGYYRVNYEETNWAELMMIFATNHEQFDIKDRAQLLDDAFALADGSQISYRLALDMTLYLVNEDDFVPWYVATSKLQKLGRRLMYTTIYSLYLEHVQNLLYPIFASLTWNIDSGDHLVNRLRVTILTMACEFGLPECLAQAVSRFENYLEDPSTKPEPDLREIIYYYGMQEIGNEDHWEQLLDIYHKETDATEKSKLLYGLAGVRSPWLLYRFIQIASDENYVRRQDYFTCIQNIAANPIGEPIVWDYVREEWPKMVERFGLNDRFLGRFIPTITQYFSTETKLSEMEAFFKKYPDAGAGTSARKQALETVKFNINWLKKNKETIDDWLNELLK